MEDDEVEVKISFQDKIYNCMNSYGKPILLFIMSITLACGFFTMIYSTVNLILKSNKMEPEDPQDSQIQFYSINKLVEEYPKSKNISIYIMKDQIKESVVKNKKCHYVKPLAIRVDNDNLDRDITWNFNLRDKEYVKIQMHKKLDFFKIGIDSTSKQNKTLPNGDKMIFYDVYLRKIVNENLIEELIGDLTSANN
jgi:hypothetical protein